jgi:SET domain-containing protein
MYITNLQNHVSKLSESEEYILPCVQVKFSNKICSRGLFATVEYNKGDIIEIAPAIKQEKKWNKGTLNDYTFSFDEKTVLIGLGYSALYNHSDKNNAYWTTIDDNKIKIVCKKRIQPGEEIFISYGANYFLYRPDLEKS